MKKIYVFLILGLFSLNLSAQNRFFYANLDGMQQVPPSGSSANGVVVAKYNTVSRLLEIWGDYKDLAASASAAHLHSPAAAGSNAGVIASLAQTGGTSGTLTGGITLTPAQEADMTAGLMYINVHNVTFTNGEIRGQLMEATNGQSNFLTGRLQGAQEVPPNPSMGRGMVRAILDRGTNQVYVTGSFTGLTTAASLGHIHRAAPTVTGPVIAGLNFSMATSGVFHTSAALVASDVLEVSKGNAYINIHSSTYPGGELRGQLIEEFSQRYLAGTLEASQEVPTNPSTATGNVIVKYNADTKLLELEGNYNSLSGNISASHIHGPAAPGVNAGVIASLTNTGGTSGTLTASLTLTTMQEADLLNGLIYVNVHSSVYPGGEIRAQLNPTVSNQTFYFKTSLQGSQEVPASGSSATGSATVLLDLSTNQLWLTGSFNGLAAAASAAHIHQGAAGSNGGVVVSLSRTAAMSGTINGTATVSSAFASQLIGGNAYVNVHNPSFPGGEIRGQLGNLVLPVTLVYFNGFKKDNSVVLQWQTADELNLRQFEVEQQADINGVWETKKVIGSSATGNSSKNYQVSDVHGKSAKPYLFYRLKMLDVDGKFTYSSVIRIKNTGSGAALSISNNPVVSDRLLFTITGLANSEQALISIIDFSGRVVYNSSVSSRQNNFVDVARLPSGLYKLVVRLNGDLLQETFSKQ